ncbi:MAG: hypothetical protein KatS3mg102_0135 [Planctomycetota bacterium]|nr:MAG: hypothetical protein KatS3mg102_0135 [Planctomycetota bacterium]
MAALVLLCCAGGCAGTPAPRARLARADCPLSFVCCYAREVRPEQLEGFALAILDAQVRAAPAAFAEQGRIVLGYLSLGETATHDPAWPEHAGQPYLVEPNPDWPGSWRVDPRAPAWRAHVLARAEWLLARGFHGFFLDTADVAAWLEERDPARFAGALEAMIELVQALRARFPEAPIVLNQGLALYPAVRPAVDAALAEGLFARYDFAARRYEPTPDDPSERGRRERFAALRRSGLRVLSVEYAPPEDTALIAHALAGCRRLGFDPYIATVELDTVRRDALELVP